MGVAASADELNNIIQPRCCSPPESSGCDSLTPFSKAHALSHRKGAYMSVCPMTYIWWKDSHWITRSLSCRKAALKNLVALRAVLLSSLNYFVAASSPLLVLLLSFHLSSSSSSLESNLHQSMSCHARASPCSSTELSVPIATCPCPLWCRPGVSRTVRSRWGFRDFCSAARDSQNPTARAWGIFNKAAWFPITHADRASPSLLWLLIHRAFRLNIWVMEK